MLHGLDIWITSHPNDVASFFVQVIHTVHTRTGAEAEIPKADKFPNDQGLLENLELIIMDEKIKRSKKQETKPKTTNSL